ncbi:MAG: S41 family peptidase [Edaphocola sp.]
MSPDKPKRFHIWMPLIYSIILVLGIFVGFQINKYMGRKRPLSNIIERNDRLEDIIDLVNTRYVDSVSTDSLYTDAINGILGRLDPHTTYIPAAEMVAATEDLEGNFKGIGIEYCLLQDTLMVTAVIKGGPSVEAGLKPGDQIIRINDSLVSGINISNDGIVRKLGGAEGSGVQLSVLRRSNTAPVAISVRRGVVPIYSVEAAYMMDKSTGYIRINRFSATTYREFLKALDNLKSQGMLQLMLDLRQNPGGYVDAATAIADELLGKGKMLVYTEGRASQKEDYVSDHAGKFEKGRLVVLVDEGSASASEILAGAVQDWDRGVIAGRRTYGKGLVQEQFELGDGAALRLTIARYFTPSGRSIQRPYTGGRAAYAKAFEHRYVDGSLTLDSDTAIPAGAARYYTKVKKRVVYGGGGIKPDITIPYEVNEAAAELYHLLSAQELNETVYGYFAQHDTEFWAYRSIGQFDAGFQVKGALENALRNAFSRKYPAATRAVWGNARALQVLQARVKGLIAKMLFRTNGYYREINQQDEVVKRAYDIISGSEYSAIIGG